ncbi:Gx transporter family protein [Sphaerochaeta sp. PS]|uniref:Gx transporter family protein n=1 Tax=Sphaerochaeta sp. PS TaxID=3076336 RepID=UPI0028A368B6|nr:Gx transporter family protein [Sphaerochaeta sp. PS]MDT4763209.1 Gx transporter family protein [Sphaerochaeta sp. PS]
MSRTERKIAFIAAATLLCSTLEYLIPKPLPFLRLGLANLPILLVLDIFTFKSFFVLLLLKSIGQGFVSGTLFSYLFFISLAGTLSSGLLMYGAKRLFGKRVSLVGCSILGAMASNLAQLEVAALLVYGASIWVAAPLMLALGLASSIVLGFMAETYKNKGKLIGQLKDDSLELELPLLSEREHNGKVALAALLAIAAILIVDKLSYLAVITALMYLLQTLAKRRIRIVPPLMLLLSMLALSLFEPFGKVLLSFGSIAFTQGAVQIALVKALRLISLLAASQCISASNPRLSGKNVAYIPLTLGYFTLLSTSFKGSKGSLIERTDQALLRTAGGTFDGASTTVHVSKRISTTLFVAVVVAVLTIAIISKIPF